MRQTIHNTQTSSIYTQCNSTIIFVINVINLYSSFFSSTLIVLFYLSILLLPQPLMPTPNSHILKKKIRTRLIFFRSNLVGADKPTKGFSNFTTTIWEIGNPISFPITIVLLPMQSWAFENLSKFDDIWFKVPEFNSQQPFVSSRISSSPSSCSNLVANTLKP